MKVVGSISEWEKFRQLEEQVIADQFAEALGEDASPRDEQEPSALPRTGSRRVPVRALPGEPASAGPLINESLREDHESRIVEGVELALKFSLTPEQTQKICGAIVGQRERVKECTKFVQNWLMHSSVAELTAYLEKK